MTLVGPVPITPAQVAAVQAMPLVPLPAPVGPTPTGSIPLPSVAMPLAPSGLPALVVNDDISQAGAKPLVTDPKLGWNTSVRLTAPNDGSHTRLASDANEFRIRSNAKWVVLAIVLALVVVALVALIIGT